MTIDVDGVVDGIPGLVWTAFPDGRADFVNQQFSEYTGMSLDESVGSGWLASVHPDDLAQILERWSSYVEIGSAGDAEARLRRFDGEYRWFLFRANPLRDEDGTIVKWCGTNTDIEDRKRAEAQLAVEKHLLEMIASGRALGDVLDGVCRFVEEISPECLCGVYPIDWSGPSFQYGVAPSLPASYVDPIKGWPVRKDIAPCGIAAFEKTQVIVPDIEADPVWGATEYRDHVAAHGLRSVWSTPICSFEGHVLGTFCVYQRQPAMPSPRDQELISHATHIASIALNRARTDEALMARDAELRRAHDQLSEGQRLSKTGTFTADLLIDRHEWSEEFYRIFEIDSATLPSIGAVRERVHADDLELFDAEIRRGMEGGEPDFTFRIVTSIGGLKHLRGVARVIEHVAGRPILMGAVQDITGSKLVEQEIRRSEAYLVEGQRLTKAGSYFWLLDTDQPPVLSDELRRILGFEDQPSVTIERIFDQIHPEDRPLAAEQIEMGRAGHSFDCVYRLLMLDGSLKYVRSFSRGARIEGGRLELIGSVLDVTESKLAEEELRRSEASLIEAQRLTRTGSFSWLLDTDEVVFSNELRRLFGFDEGVAVTPEGCMQRVHPDDVALAAEQMTAARDGRDVDFVVRLQLPDGSTRHLREFGHAIRNHAGRPTLVGSVQDVTEGKLAEAALTAQAAELRRAYDYLTEAQRLSKTGSFTWDVFADEHNWSEEIRRIFGFESDAKVTIGMIQAAVHPDDMAEVERVLGGAPEGRDFDLVFRILTTNGEVRHAHVVGHRIADIMDRPVFLGALQDVTQAKVAEAAIRASEAELRRANSYLTIAQRLSKTGSFIWDLQANERQWSEEMYRLFGFDLKSPMPASVARDLAHPEDMPIIEALLQQALQGRDFDGEFRLTTPRGILKHVHVMGHRLEEAKDHWVFVVAAQDITDRKLAEERLDRARRELAHVSRVTALSALTASIAHEVNQPLAGIVANASTCLRLLAMDPPNTEGAQATAQRTIRDANRASEVIKRLRALFARRPPDSEPLDLNVAAREVLTLASSELEGAHVVMQTDLAGDLPTIIGDRVQLQQVILNLVLNAADAMRTVDDRPRELSISTVRDGDDHVRLSVRDAGVGAKAEQIEQFFNAFYTTKPEGMGVGLSISRSIIEAHGGRIWASENDGPGLTFSVCVPVTAPLLIGAEDDDDLDPDGAISVSVSRKS